MSENIDSFLTLSSSRNQPSLLWAALFVIVMHIGLLAIGKHWNPSPPKPKERQKVVVQTIRLESGRPSSAQIHTAFTPPPSAMPQLQPKSIPTAELPKPAEAMPKEEIASREEIASPQVEEKLPKVEANLPELEKEIIKEKPAPIEEVKPLPTEEKPAPPVPKKESKPQPKATPPKPAVKEVKKAPEKKTAPVKKPAETAKKPAKQEASKAKPKSDADKKKQQEKTEAEKKQQKELAEADKKKQQEKAEADKKKQQEKAEADKKHQKEQAEAEKKRQQEAAAEKKRQQEIAAAEEAARQKEAVLISKAKENLAKMGETRDKISTSPSTNIESTAIPKELGTLQVDALPVEGPRGSGDWGTKEVSYSGEVASRLKKALKLPDYGAVKIKLTLDRTGKVITVEIVQSESSKNKAYVESKIPTLLFPPFGQRFKDASQNTFVITLQNDS